MFSITSSYFLLPSSFLLAVISVTAVHSTVGYLTISESSSYSTLVTITSFCRLRRLSFSSRYYLFSLLVVVQLLVITFVKSLYVSTTTLEDLRWPRHLK